MSPNAVAQWQIDELRGVLRHNGGEMRPSVLVRRADQLPGKARDALEEMVAEGIVEHTHGGRYVRLVE